MEEKIEYLLSEVSKLIEDKSLDDLGVDYRKIDGEYFEKVFKKKCEEIIEKQEFQGIKLEDIRGHKFPDFILNYSNKKYGVEIKSSEKGNWTIPGNSVYENTPTGDFEDIFVFFGSYKEYKNGFEIKFMEYWKAVKDIKVTHSPRFEISVNPDINTDFFDSWESFVDFKQQSKDKKTELLQKFLREQKEGQNLWYVQSADEQAEPMLFEELEKEMQSEILAKCFILFSSDIFRVKYLQGSQKYSMDSNYKGILRYLLEEYFVFSPSIRDKFSSGGRKGLVEDDTPPKFPAVFKKFSDLGTQIYNILEKLDKGELNDFKETLLSIWNENEAEAKYDGNSFIESYKTHLDSLENKPNLQYIIREELPFEDKTDILSSKISL
ncbi:hypothetical protein [Streptococcus infantis]|uniref:hypothetical protein n=1 Tax=Streptococcus infantis TaxID=68892 RepID=UPI0039C3DC31